MAEEGSNKRIVKNTVYLYFRSILMLLVSLYTSRVILQSLGVSDYGLYGAIGSIVAMFTIINGVLSAGTGRFLTFELGKGDGERLQRTFSASFAMHAALAVILFFLLETIGLWFVNFKLNIPEGREFAANIVYQLSILTCMLSLTQVPYGASIIAHERMNIYAYVGILEAFFKLALVTFLLYVPTNDNLIAYAIIIAAWSIGLQLFYRYYCYKRFPESHLTICKDKSIYKGMLSYSLWDFVGQFCATGGNQGLNLLINVFFGVTVNAARAVAYQVDNAVLMFVNNFTTALNPQIVKSYAKGDKDRYFQLIHTSAKFSFFLMSLFVVPILLEADFVLSVWLKEVPEWTSLFLRCIISIALFRTFANPVIRGVHATGDVKFLNASSGLFSLFTYLPFIYILYALGFPVWTCFIPHAIGAIGCSYLELLSLQRAESFSIREFVINVHIKSIAIIVLGSIPSVAIHCLLCESWLRLIATTTSAILSLGLCIYYLGLSKDVQRQLISFVRSKLNI